MNLLRGLWKKTISARLCSVVYFPQILRFKFNSMYYIYIIATVNKSKIVWKKIIQLMHIKKYISFVLQINTRITTSVKLTGFTILF